MSTLSDSVYMKRAIEVSLQGRVTAPPNPWVGCVLVNKDTIVGEGFTSPAGSNHAEINALQQAGDKAIGATAYVTLEPCSHYGKTPPCTLALIEAKIARVVVATQDPDPRVSGRGIAQLREKGIEVTLDVENEAARECLAPYLHQRSTGLPYCVVKAGASIDGRIAAKDGSSQWITGEKARNHSHELRAQSQAILIGSGTAISDQPRLTVRNVNPLPKNPPLRVVLDSKGIIDIRSPLFDISLAPTLVITTQNCSDAQLKKLNDAGVQTAIVSVGKNNKGVNLQETLKLLGERGILQVLVEGGGTLVGSLLTENLIQRLCLYIGPCILGNGGLPLFNTDTISSLSSAPKLVLKEVMQLEDSLYANYVKSSPSHRHT